jgi:hypothetical protein
MMDRSKIRLSGEELELVKSTDWILTKHRVIAKVYDMFGLLAVQMQEYIKYHHNGLPAALDLIAPKISKGEQYEQLPWVVLDYPRIFSKSDVFAVRTFFWWGNYFSVSLQVKGKYLEPVVKTLLSPAVRQDYSRCYCSVSGDEFSFTLDGSAYLAPGQWEALAAGDVKDYFKISCQFALGEWETVDGLVMIFFDRLMTVLAGQLPMR